MSGSPTGRGRLLTWIDARYGISPLIEFLREKEVPVGAHSMVWYFLGGATLFFLTVQIISGVLLLMYYQPGENTSWESIRYIVTQVPFGWLIRSVHCWSAHLMIVSLVVHMFSTMMLKAYRPPRELTWVTGFVLFSLVLGFGFSGYLLPWNELAFFATAVGTDSVKSVPLVGDWLLQVMRGGPDVTIDTLYRFFALHVTVLPIVTIGLIAVHLLFIQRQGMAAPVGETHAPRGIRFFPNFLMRDLLLWLVCLAMLVTLALLFPYGPGIPGFEWELGQKADPLAPAFPGIKPEWYFLWIYQLLKEFPPHLFGLEGPQVCLLVVIGLMTIWTLIPWLDRAARRNEPSPAFSDFGVAAILFLVFLTLKAWDIGGNAEASPDGLPDPAAVAWISAWILTGLAAAITGLRIAVYQHRWFLLSGCALLHAVLHGLLGLSYLAAGAIAAAGGTVAVAVWLRRTGGAAPIQHGAEP
jgi:cytochrome b6